MEHASRSRFRDEGTALGDDAHGVVEVPKEGVKLLFGAAGDIEVIGKKEDDAVGFVGGKRGLDGVRRDAEEFQ